MNNNTMIKKNIEVFKAAFTVLALLMMAVSVSGHADHTFIITPTVEDDWEYFEDDDIFVEWEVEAAHDDRELIESRVIVDDKEGNRITYDIDQNILVEEGDTFQDDFTVNYDDWSSELNNGEAYVEVWDTWESHEDEQGTFTSSQRRDISLGVFGEYLIEITSPDDEYYYQGMENLEVEWQSSNNFNTDKELQTTDIEIEDQEGNIVTETVSKNDVIERGTDKTHNEEFEPENLEDSLENGIWEIEITDYWEDEQITASVEIDAEISWDEHEDYDVSLTINSIQPENPTYLEDDITIEWSSTNSYDFEHELEETEITIEDKNGVLEIIELEIEELVGEDDLTTNTETIESSNLNDLIPGEWSLTVEDKWEHETDSETVTFDVEEDGKDDEESDVGGEPDIILGAPSSGDEFDWETGEISVEWTSVNDFDQEVELEDTLVIFEGDTGGTQKGTISQDENIGEGEELDHEVTFTNGSWDTLVPGDFTLTVRDEWSTGDEAEESVDIAVDTEDDEAVDSEDDSTEEDGQDDTEEETTDETGEADTEDTDDTTEETEDESTGDESADDIFDDEQAEVDTTPTDDEETDEEKQDCPEGYVWDEEFEICVESDSQQDDSVGALDSVTSPEVAGIPVWLITVLAVFAGLQAYWWKR